MASVSLLHSTSPRTLRRHSYSLVLSRALHNPWLRKAALIVVLFGLFEVGVRLLEYASDLPFDDARSAEACKLSPGAMLAGRPVNSLGYWDDEFSDAQAPSGANAARSAGASERRRVAILGGLPTLGGDADTNFTAQLERILPDVEVDHFGLPAAGPREYSAQLVRDVLKRKPARVLICLEATNDFAPRNVDRPRLDCRSLQLVEVLFTPATATAVAAQGPLQLGEVLDYDEYVRRRASTVMTSHRTAGGVHDVRRREAQAAVERVVRICKKRNIPLTLVLVPGEFQLSSSLTAAFCRRMQCDPSDLETELPQRRWSALAEHLQVSTIDLLPALREKGEIVYVPNSADWNARGQTIVAETIARDLRNRGI